METTLSTGSADCRSTGICTEVWVMMVRYPKRRVFERLEPRRPLAGNVTAALVGFDLFRSTGNTFYGLELLNFEAF
jgi:hypothetical protein